MSATSDAIDAQSCLLLQMQECEDERQENVDFASLALAIATYAIYDQYYDKYKDILDWRDEIGMRIKECLEKDIDHYIGVVMAQMDKAITDILNSPTVSVEYGEIITRYTDYLDNVAQAALGLVDEIESKTCDTNPLPCDFTESDLLGWATMAAISAADGRVRFDEARVPRRLDLISGALDSAHSATFRLPDFDYQALSNSANLASSLASAYSGLANSALGSFGYFSTNFINSLN